MKKFIILLVLVAVAATASAQTHINSLVAKLEKSDGADLTFVEKRNPTTHEIASEQYVFVIPPADIKNVISTIASDRQQSVSYSVVGGKIYRVQFKNGDVTTDVVFVKDRPSVANEAFMAGIPAYTNGDNILMVKRTYKPKTGATKE